MPDMLSKTAVTAVPEWLRAATRGIPAVVVLIALLNAGPAAAADVPCAACHAEAAASFSTTPHGATLDGNCTVCHGDGAAHLASPSAATIRTFSSEPPAEQNAVCTGCHREQELAQTNAHSAAGLACSSCHTIHVKKKS